MTKEEQVAEFGRRDSEDDAASDRPRRRDSGPDKRRAGAPRGDKRGSGNGGSGQYDRRSTGGSRDNRSGGKGRWRDDDGRRSGSRGNSQAGGGKFDDRRGDRPGWKNRDDRSSGRPVGKNDRRDPSSKRDDRPSWHKDRRDDRGGFRADNRGGDRRFNDRGENRRFNGPRDGDRRFNSPRDHDRPFKGQRDGDRRFGGGRDDNRQFGRARDDDRRSGGARDRDRNFRGPRDEDRRFGGPRGEDRGGSRDKARTFGGPRDGDRRFGGGHDRNRSAAGSHGGDRNFGGSRDKGRDFGGSHGGDRSFGGPRDKGRAFGGSREDDRRSGGRRDDNRRFDGPREDDHRSSGGHGDRQFGGSRDKSRGFGRPGDDDRRFGGSRQDREFRGSRDDDRRAGGPRDNGRKFGEARDDNRRFGGPRDEERGHDRPQNDRRFDREDERGPRDGERRFDNVDRPGGDRRGNRPQGKANRLDRSSGPRRSRPAVPLDDATLAKELLEAPELPEDINFEDLDEEARRELRTLPRGLAETVGKHLVAAGGLIDTDPEAALEHARYAKTKASRVAIVREALGLVSYHAGHWSEALSELRAVRRMTRTDTHIAVIADAERAMGRPERALDLAKEVAGSRLPRDVEVELRIVAAGARRDMGQLDAAVVSLQGPDLDAAKRDPWSARLFYAYADNLAAAGRRDEAIEWFLNAAQADNEEETDAADRAAALSNDDLPPGTFEDDLDEQELLDGTQAADVGEKSEQVVEAEPLSEGRTADLREEEDAVGLTGAGEREPVSEAQADNPDDPDEKASAHDPRDAGDATTTRRPDDD
ncbi:hypothetical protein [Amycolatopsis pithecellobii]|uniref:hypothetical protein n=1 Tax=Amycolatopsis pithecellobii TaxID=664692 RepID=UPI001FEAA4F7|nr:hypothetical protein [Amycolatopsis pithecellobii]